MSPWIGLLEIVEAKRFVLTHALLQMIDREKANIIQD
jgi:hypothetical protein